MVSVFFGSSKTIRGIVFSMLMSAAGAVLVGLEWKIGLAIGGVAMAGDLFTSFVKRRVHMPAGSRATGLDQIPESLFPLLACRHTLSLTVLNIIGDYDFSTRGSAFVAHVLQVPPS